MPVESFPAIVSTQWKQWVGVGANFATIGVCMEALAQNRIHGHVLVAGLLMRTA